LKEAQTKRAVWKRVVFTTLVYGSAAYLASEYRFLYLLVYNLTGMAYYPLPSLMLLLGSITVCWWFSRRGVRFAGVAGVLLCGALLYGAAGYYVFISETTETIEYVDGAVPILDTIKAETGTYPARLPLELTGSLNGFLRPDSYRSNGEVYCIEYYDCMSLWWSYEFVSDERCWSAYHSRHQNERSSARYKFP
jgi:hypothetical protein